MPHLKMRGGVSVHHSGCGPLGVLDLLSDRVGIAGEVVGLDNESRMIALADRAVAERGPGNVRLLEADAYASNLPADSFGVAHERLVLNNVTAPESVVGEMVRIVHPGGWVALQDVDWITWTCEPPHPAWRELLAALTATRQAAGLDPFIGRRLPALLRGAGMVDVDVRAYQYIWRPGDLYHSLLVRFVAIHRSRIIDGGRLTSERIDELTAELEQHLAQPETIVIYTPLFQAWGRKS
jgi:ubiquinone/menaquinone biosynthesis C-methylase UbiE